MSARGTPPFASRLDAHIKRRVVGERNKNVVDSAPAPLGHTKHVDDIPDGPELQPRVLRRRQKYLLEDVFYGGPLVGRCSARKPNSMRRSEEWDLDIRREGLRDLDVARFGRRSRGCPLARGVAITLLRNQLTFAISAERPEGLQIPRATVRHLLITKRPKRRLEGSSRKFGV